MMSQLDRQPCLPYFSFASARTLVSPLTLSLSHAQLSTLCSHLFFIVSSSDPLCPCPSAQHHSFSLGPCTCPLYFRAHIDASKCSLGFQMQPLHLHMERSHCCLWKFSISLLSSTQHQVPFLDSMICLNYVHSPEHLLHQPKTPYLMVLLCSKTSRYSIRRSS